MILGVDGMLRENSRSERMARGVQQIGMVAFPVQEGQAADVSRRNGADRLLRGAPTSLRVEQ